MPDSRSSKRTAGLLGPPRVLWLMWAGLALLAPLAARIRSMRLPRMVSLQMRTHSSSSMCQSRLSKNLRTDR